MATNVHVINQVSTSVRSSILRKHPELICSIESGFTDVSYIPIDLDANDGLEFGFGADVPLLRAIQKLVPTLIPEPANRPQVVCDFATETVSETKSTDSTYTELPIDRGHFEEQQIAEHDPLDCALFAPPSAAPGDEVFLQVFVYKPTQAQKAKRLALECDAEASRRASKTLGTFVRHGAKLEFALTLDSIDHHIEPESLTWTSRIDSVQFCLKIPATEQPRTIVGRLSVAIDSVPIGQMKFKLRITTERQASNLSSVGEVSRYRKAFISYASQDRKAVQERLGMLTAAGISYFQDILDLDPGDRWERKLYLKIDESDVMFLFWSTAAKQSEWVEREWRYGLEKKGDEYIRPVIIEGPPVPTPPTELNHQHFNDKVRYLIKAMEQ